MKLRFWQQSVEPSAREMRDEWLEWMRLSGIRDATRKSYRLTTDKLLKRFPELLFSEFTDDHILGIVEEARPASRMQVRGAFSNFFGWGYRTKRLNANPMHFIPTYKQVPQEPVEIFTEAECTVLCALPHPDGPLMAVLLESGLRKAEARNLTVRRIDFDAAELHVVEGAKGGHARVVPIGARLVQRLAEYVLLEGLNPEDHLWYCHPGGQVKRAHDRPIVDASMHNWWKRCVEAAGIPYRNMHTTRHTYATEWRRRGLMVDDVGFLLGHRDLKTTHRVYIHTRIFDVRRRMDALPKDKSA